MNFKGNSLTSRYFMLNAACATASDLPTLQHVYCDGENLVATNGKILVWTQNIESLPKGYYDVGEAGTGRNKVLKFVPFTDPKAENWTYPNWKQVIPNCTGCKELEFHGGSVNVEQDIFLLQFSLASHGTGALIAQEFIDLICKPELTYTVRVIDGMSPVVFECGTFFSFVVMPRRDRVKSATAEMIAGFKEDVIREWKATRDASEGRPRIDPVDAEPVPEEPTAQADGSNVDQEQQETPQDAPQPEPEQEAAPETNAPQDAPEATETQKQQKTRKRKPSFAYVCELENGDTITLDSMAEVEARGDVVKYNIEPAKKRRAA